MQGKTRIYKKLSDPWTQTVIWKLTEAGEGYGAVWRREKIQRQLNSMTNKRLNAII